MRTSRILTQLRRMARPARVWLACLAIVSSTVAAGASEIILQNDSTPAVGQGTPLINFIPGERIAGWFTSPVAGDIVGVQFLWSSTFGGSPTMLETAITVSSAGVFPAPGATLATIVAPALADGVLNEFRYLDPSFDTMPLQVSVTAGQTFVVDLEFLNTNAGNQFASSIEIDLDGTLPGVNSIFVVGPNTWLDSQLLGVTGDFGIRAIIKPIPEPSSYILLLAAIFATGAVRLFRPAR